MALLTENNGSSCTVDCVSAEQQTNPPKKILTKKIPKFGVIDIPTTMDQLGWVEAARHMRYWFNGERYIIPVELKQNVSATNIQTLRQENHLFDEADISQLKTRSKRFKEDIEKIEASLSGQQQEYTPYIGRNKDTLDLLSPGLYTFIERIDAQSLLDSDKKTIKSGYYDYANLTAAELDYTTQFNRELIGTTIMEQALDELDDVYGAFGALTIKFAVTKFNVTQKELGFQAIEIEEIGIYIRDSYDFIGNDQILGYWCEDDVLKPSVLTSATVKLQISDWPAYIDYSDKRYFRITNGDFNDYRQKNNKGGDFITYSKIYGIQTDITIHLGDADFSEYRSKRGI